MLLVFLRYRADEHEGFVARVAELVGFARRDKGEFAGPEGIGVAVAVHQGALTRKHEIEMFDVVVVVRRVAAGLQGENAERKGGNTVAAAEHELFGDAFDALHVHGGLGHVVEFADDQVIPPWSNPGRV